MNELLTINEAADLLGVHPETLRRWDRENKLPAVKINDRGDRRYNKGDLEYFMENNTDWVIDEFLGYTIRWKGKGFISMDKRFAVIGKIYAARGSEFIGFAFVADSLSLFAKADRDPGLNNLAISKVKEYLAKDDTFDGDIFTFEYKRGEFYKVLNPEWWEERYRKSLLRGLMVEVGATYPTTSEKKAWRIILNYRSKSNGVWITNAFGRDRQHTEYYVFVDAQD